MKRFSACFALLLIFFTARCHKDDAATPARGKLCAEGGAALDTRANACVCPGAQTWNGLRCETAVATGTGAEAAAAAPAEAAEKTATAAAAKGDDADAGGEGEGAGGHAAAKEAEGGKKEPAAKPAGGGRIARLRAACLKAKATWVAQEAQCLCPKDQVLVGDTCRTLHGRVTDDVCERAVAKGKWRAGACLCPAGKVFVPNRGGCVAPDTKSVAGRRRACESSLNQGTWDAVHDRCACPTGRIWIAERCEAQQLLTSREVCESGTNRGQWQAAKKRCACPVGRIWLHQSCVALSGVTPEAGCVSEGSRGTWDAKAGVCSCPAGSGWQVALKSCL